MAAAARTGARLFVERLQPRMAARHAGDPRPPDVSPSARSSGPDELLALMTEVLDGTLDAHSRAT